MKRILFISLALVLVAGFVVTAYAEDRLSLGGEYRVRGFYSKNLSNFNSDNKADEQSYFDQRFRMGAKITAAEGVTANFRFDFGEEVWGTRQPTSLDAIAGGAANSIPGSASLTNTVPGSGRPTENGELQIDRLYLRIERDIANFAAGQYAGAFGYTSAFETQSKWLLLRVKPGPMFIDLAYIKLDEGFGTTDNDESPWTEDADVYALNFMYNGEKFGVGAFGGYRVDKTRNRSLTLALATTLTATTSDAVRDSDLTGFGLYFNGSFGIVDVKAEVDIFSGENKTSSPAVPATTPPSLVSNNDKVDLKGQQFWAYGNFKFGDTMALPVHFTYAKGYANKAGETQVVEMAPAFGDFYPNNLSSIWNGDYQPYPGGEAFDVAGTGGGVMALMAGFDWAVVDQHKLEFQLGYAAPEDEIKYVAGTTTGAQTLESFIWGAAGWQWNFVPAADFSAVLLYSAPSYADPNQKDDAGYGLFTKIRVKF
jgi:hypothetical protein